MKPEAQLVGAFLADGSEAFRLHGRMIPPLKDPLLAEVVERMRRLTAAGRAWSLGTITAEFDRHPIINDAYLIGLATNGGSTGLLRLILQDISDERFREDLQILQEHTHTKPAAELAAQLQGMVLQYQRSRTDSWDRAGAIDRLRGEIERDLAGAPQIFTGIDAVDRFCGGQKGGEVTFLGARPSVGKSAFAVTIANNLIRKGHSVLYLDLETQDTTLLERFVSLATEIPVWKISRRCLDEQELAKIVDAFGEIQGLPLTINDSMGMTIGDIQAQAISCSAELIILDYLHLFARSSENEVSELGDAMIGLVELAKALDIPVLCLGQLNRRVEHRADPRPLLSDIRGSGKIEEYAFRIWFLDYPYRYDDQAEPNHKVLWIAKDKHGPTGKVDLHWEGATMRYGAMK